MKVHNIGKRTIIAQEGEILPGHCLDCSEETAENLKKLLPFEIKVEEVKKPSKKEKNDSSNSKSV